MAARRKARVERGASAPCSVCSKPTLVLIRVWLLDEEGEPERQTRICVPCFKAVVDHLTAGRPKPGTP